KSMQVANTRQSETGKSGKEQKSTNEVGSSERGPSAKSVVRRSHSRARVSTSARPVGASGNHMMLPQGGPDFPAAMLDPHNRTGGAGEDLLSGNYHWALGILGLAGRAGLDLDLALSYNPLATWVRSGNFMDFDYDNG